MSRKEMVEVTVTVDDAHRGKLAQVAKGLRAEGFVLSASMDAIGVLAGKVPAENVDKLAGVAGVTAVERNRTDYRTQ